MTASAAICGMPASAARSWLSGGSFILRVEIAVAEKPGQEFGLVAGWIEVQSSPFHNRVDNSLTAVADESDSVLAAAFQCEDQRCCGDCDDDAKRAANATCIGMRRGCFDDAFSPLLGQALSPPADRAPADNFQARSNFGPTMDIRRSANCEQEERRV